jgi:hypothetical protein
MYELHNGHFQFMIFSAVMYASYQNPRIILGKVKISGLYIGLNIRTTI